jgi:PAS domain-containing protein
MGGSDQSQALLAIVEAEVGSLLELLPVPLLVTSETGDILRANAAARVFLDAAVPVIGTSIDDLLQDQAMSVCVRVLRHEGHVVRVYALQHPLPRVVVRKR